MEVEERRKMGKAWEHLSREVDVGGGGVPGYVHINPECEFCYWSSGVPFVSHKFLP